MELEFEKVSIPCLRSVLREVKEQEETLELRVQDGQPDVERVVTCWGQPVIRTKEWRNNGVCINGGISLRVLYVSEQENDIQCLEAWMPFQVKCDFKDYEDDGWVTVHPLLHSLDARMVSERKILLRAVVGMYLDAMVRGKVELCTPGNTPEDIQLLKKTYSVQIPRNMGEKAFSVEEQITLPGTLSKVLYYNIAPTVTEKKVIADKVIFRGVLCLHMLYCDVSGQIVPFDTELLFSQFSELGADFSPEAEVQVTVTVSGLDLEKGEDGNHKLTAGLIGQYLILDREELTLLEDAYSHAREVSVSCEHLYLPATASGEVCKYQACGTIDDQDLHIIDGMFYPAQSMCYKDNDGLVTQHSGFFSILGYDNEGRLVSKNQSWNESDHSPWKENKKSVCTPLVAVCPKISAAGLKTELAADVTADRIAFEDMNVQMVTKLSANDEQQKSDDRPALILRRAGGATLWEIAKSSFSTVDKIKEANDLQEQPEPDRMLLIPVI